MTSDNINQQHKMAGCQGSIIYLLCYGTQSTQKKKKCTKRKEKNNWLSNAYL